MAKQYKKILKKIKPKVKTVSKKPEKSGKDYLLLSILSFTIIVMCIGWMHFSNTNRALYVTLIISLFTTYIRRHAKLSELQDIWAERIGYVAMGFAVVLFAFVIYEQYFM